MDKLSSAMLVREKLQELIKYLVAEDINNDQILAALFVEVTAYNLITGVPSSRLIHTVQEMDNSFNTREGNNE